MGAGGVGGRWRKAGLVRCAGADGGGEGVVDFENGELGAKTAVGFFIVAADDRERVHDVVGVIARDAVEVEERSVEFAAEQKAALFVPAKWRAVVAHVLRAGLEIPGGVG